MPRLDEGNYVLHVSASLPVLGWSSVATSPIFPCFMPPTNEIIHVLHHHFQLVVFLPRLSYFIVFFILHAALKRSNSRSSHHCLYGDFASYFAPSSLLIHKIPRPFKHRMQSFPTTARPLNTFSHLSINTSFRKTITTAKGNYTSAHNHQQDDPILALLPKTWHPLRKRVDDGHLLKDLPPPGMRT